MPTASTTPDVLGSSAMGRIEAAVERLGRVALRVLAYLNGVSLLAWQSLRACVTRPIYVRDILRQCEAIGVLSLTIVIVTVLFTGMVLSLQTAVGLTRFGAKLYIGNIVSLAIVRELGPGFAALMLAGRVGSGIAAELGSMKVTEQVDAIRSMGIEPVRKLVAPRVIAATLMLPLLAMVADLTGIFGGMIIAATELDISPHFYLNSVRNTIVLGDVMHGITKAFFFGFFVAIIGCYNGLRTTGGTVGVGRNTTQSVVIASIVILVSDYFLTKFLLWL